MRYAVVTAFASLAAIAVSATPSLSLERLAKPAHSASIVTPVADLDRSRTMRQPRYRRADSHWNWRYRAAYTRWLHNEYVNAGFPVRHYGSPTYILVEDCCWRDRHW